MESITKDRKISLIYEVFIAMLALIAVSMAFLDLTDKISIESSKSLYNVDLSILVIFSIDYITRITLSSDKKDFFKKNILDLIAIIPFNSLFRAFRIVRLVRVFRITKIAKLTKLTKLIRLVRLIVYGKKLMRKIDRFIHTNGFIYVLNLTVTTIILGSIGIYYAEQGTTINSIGDAIWWSFVTTTTVGYGDISPVTVSGRIIAAILMIIGIGFIGMLTGTIATYFLSRKDKKDNIAYDKKVIDLSALSRDEYKEVLSYIEFVKSKREA